MNHSQTLTFFNTMHIQYMSIYKSRISGGQCKSATGKGYWRKGGLLHHLHSNTGVRYRHICCSKLETFSNFQVNETFPKYFVFFNIMHIYVYTTPQYQATRLVTSFYIASFICQVHVRMCDKFSMTSFWFSDRHDS